MTNAHARSGQPFKELLLFDSVISGYKNNTILMDAKGSGHSAQWSTHRSPFQFLNLSLPVPSFLLPNLQIQYYTQYNHNYAVVTFAI